MSTIPATPQLPPTPERFFGVVNAYQQTEAIKSAIELDLFTAIAEGKTTSATIALHCQASERGVRILSDFLAIHGFLAKQGDQYTLAPDAAFFLNRRSPAYVGACISFLLTPHIRRAHDSLTEAVRRGVGEVGVFLGLPGALGGQVDFVEAAEADAVLGQGGGGQLG